MPRILMILALCTLATAPRADTQLTPWMFDLQKRFDECINTPSDNLYRTCQGALAASFSLRREIGYALDGCHTANVKDCAAAFNNAGFPADRLKLSALDRCTMLGKLEETSVSEIPNDSCIEQIARNIERNNIPTTRDTSISCGIECAGIIDISTTYWERAVSDAFHEKLNAVSGLSDFGDKASTSYRYYGLLKRRHALQIDLAETNCSILTVMPHWANVIDYRECMGEAYADMWINLNKDEE